METGYWGPVTANIDWCESNYEITYYVAEFWNTISNFGMVALSLVGAFEGWRGKQVENHFVFPFVAMMAVGMGSTLFHMSLKYHLQLMDEMPMIWGTGALLYAIYELNKDHKGINWPLLWTLLAFCSMTSMAYLVLDNRLIFEGTYGSMVITAMILLRDRVFTIDRGAIKFFFLALLFYLSAVVFWAFDRMFCNELMTLRQNLHSSFHVFSQFHALWHFFVGLSAHTFMLVITRTRLAHLSKPSSLKYRFGVMPYYDVESAKDHLN